jgi:hypothetical protein
MGSPGGGEAPWRGVWGCPPTKPSKGGELPALATPPRVGPKTLAKKANGGGQMGSPGGGAPWRGAWGVSPHKTLKGGELPTLATPPRVGPKTPASPKPTGVGKWEVQGGEAPWRGVVGGVPPQNLKRGRVAHISNPATSGTQNAGEPKANGGGQMGVQGGEAPWRGAVGGVPPQNLKRGRVAHISNPATSGTQNAGEPKANGGGQMGGPGGRSPHGGGMGVSSTKP